MAVGAALSFRAECNGAEESLGRRSSARTLPERCFDSASGSAQHDKASGTGNEKVEE